MAAGSSVTESLRGGSGVSPGGPEVIGGGSADPLGARYSVVDEGETPLPRQWSAKDKCTYLGLSQGNLRVHYKGMGKNHKDAASVRSTHPIPTACGIYYFEIKVISKGREGYLGIGLSTSCVSVSRLPGWEKNSYGYHGDDGNSFSSSGSGQPYGPTFTTGDVIGCCVNLIDNSCFYTKNGVNLGIAFRNLPANLYPTVGLQTPGEVIDANFGQNPFVFDIDDYTQEWRSKTRASIEQFAIENKHGEWQTALQKIVSSYLVHNGYCATAEAFARCTGQQIEEDTSSMRNRQKIQALILSGQLGEAIDLTRHCYPGLLETNASLLFALKCRQFIEMVNGTEILSIGQGDSAAAPLPCRTTSTSPSSRSGSSPTTNSTAGSIRGSACVTSRGNSPSHATHTGGGKSRSLSANVSAGIERPAELDVFDDGLEERERDREGALNTCNLALNGSALHQNGAAHPPESSAGETGLNISHAPSGSGHNPLATSPIVSGSAQLTTGASAELRRHISVGLAEETCSDNEDDDMDTSESDGKGVTSSGGGVRNGASSNGSVAEREVCVNGGAEPRCRRSPECDDDMDTDQRRLPSPAAVAPSIASSSSAQPTSTRRLSSLSATSLETILQFGRELHTMAEQLREGEGSGGAGSGGGAGAIGGASDANRKILKDAFSLLAYSDPWSSSVGYQLHPVQREPVCTSLNSAILELQGLPKRSPLELAIAQARQCVRLMTRAGIGTSAFANVPDYLH